MRNSGSSAIQEFSKQMLDSHEILVRTLFSSFLIAYASMFAFQANATQRDFEFSSRAFVEFSNQSTPAGTFNSTTAFTFSFTTAETPLSTFDGLELYGFGQIGLVTIRLVSEDESHSREWVVDPANALQPNNNGQLAEALDAELTVDAQTGLPRSWDLEFRIADVDNAGNGEAFLIRTTRIITGSGDRGFATASVGANKQICSNAFCSGGDSAATNLQTSRGDVEGARPGFWTVRTDSDEASLNAAVLPSSRAPAVGSLATVFATIINSSSSNVSGCTISLPLELQPSVGFFFQRTNPTTNATIGEPNEAAELDAGASQTFVLGLTPNEAFPTTIVPLVYECAEGQFAQALGGVNTLLFSANTAPVADVVALGATPTNNGIFQFPAISGGAFSVASVNVGAAANILVTPGLTRSGISSNLSICETNPLTGACINPTVPAAQVNLNVAPFETPTFSIFATSTETVQLDPARTRVTVTFSEATSGQIVGSTSVALQVD